MCRKMPIFKNATNRVLKPCIIVKSELVFVLSNLLLQGGGGLPTLDMREG